MTNYLLVQKIVSVLLVRLCAIRLRRLNGLLTKVNRGEVLNEFDIAFIEQVLAEAVRDKAVFDNNPEYHQAYQSIVSLCAAIIDRGVENEPAQG